MPPDKFGVNLRGMAGIRRFYALNEVAITRGALGRIIELSLDISGIPVSQMRGDGLVVSTATGSTAYALSAGGPLTSPRFDGMIAVPLAPHTLRARTIVTDRSDVIEVRFESPESYREATLFVDGEIVPFERPLHKVYVQCAPMPVILLRDSDSSFYKRISRDFFGE
jgi:NAD+ kinase